MKKRAQILLRNGRALTGAQNAAELDLTDYLPLCHKLAWRCRWRMHFNSHEDALQIAMLGLIKARDKWDPQRGPFATIAQLYIRSEFKEEVQRQRKRAPLNLPAVITVAGVERDLCELLVDETPDPEELIIARDELCNNQQRITAALAVLGNDDDQDCIVIEGLYFSDPPTPWKELAAKLGVSVARVSQIHVAALSRMRAALNGEMVAPRRPKKPQLSPRKGPCQHPQPSKVVIPAPKPPRRAVVAPAVAFA